MASTPTPEPEYESLVLKAEGRYTEMGYEVRIHSQAVNITVELDLDFDPVYFHAVLASVSQIVNEQLMKAVLKAIPEEE